jgi:hypothetical protein
LLTPIILATQKAEIRRIVVQSQPRQLVPEILSQKNPSKKKKTGGVAQCVGPEFKPQNYRKERKKERRREKKEGRKGGREGGREEEK